MQRPCVNGGNSDHCLRSSFFFYLLLVTHMKPSPPKTPGVLNCCTVLEFLNSKAELCVRIDYKVDCIGGQVKNRGLRISPESFPRVAVGVRL